MGAGALLVDESGRILLVEPSYKPVWEIPGGVIEKDESPKACVVREIKEELGLKVAVGRLLIVDYNAPTEEKSESLMFIFDGGVLTCAEMDTIQLQQEELLSFKFFEPTQLPTNLSSTLRQRILTAYQRRADGPPSWTSPISTAIVKSSRPPPALACLAPRRQCRRPLAISVRSRVRSAAPTLIKPSPRSLTTSRLIIF
jgi:ADP-ribose pyrophosphatase YjhB (NUDIX family)